MLHARLLHRLVAFSLLLLAAAPTRAADRVVIGQAIPLTVTDGGVYAMAEELGLFAAEGIEVQHVVLPGAGAVLPQILQRQVTFGFPLTETLLSSHQPGQAPLPLVYVYNAGPYNSLEIAVKADGPIRTLADLRGKGIGVGALTWGTIPQTRALLRSVGWSRGATCRSSPSACSAPASMHCVRTGSPASTSTAPGSTCWR